MDIFGKAFNRKKSDSFKRKGRELTDLLNLVNKRDIPSYVILYQSAIANYEAGNLNSALADINKTIEGSDIDDWKHFALKARILEGLKDYIEAIKNYEIAIDVAVEDLGVYALYHQIAICYLTLGNNHKAIEFFSYAIDLKKSHPNTEFNSDIEGEQYGVLLGLPFKRMYVNRSSAYVNIGKLNEAHEDCVASLRYDKNYSNPYLLLSQIYSKAGQEEKAMEFLNIAAQLGNQNALYTLNKLRK